MTDDLIRFFGLTEDPFGPLRDATDVLEAPSQSQVISQVLTDVASEPGVVTLRGQAGVGKTSICQLIALALRLHGVLAVEVAGGRHNPMQIHTLIGHIAGIAAPERLTPEQLARELPERLGRNGMVLVIDDAQRLSETDYRYVLLLRAALGFTSVGFGLILVGSAGRWPALETADALALRPETMARHVIFALREEELAALLQHRFRLAGRSATQVLSPAAAQGLVREAEGVPGVLATLTASAMAAAYARRRRRVTLRGVWRSLSPESGRSGLIWRSLRGPAAAAACLVLLGAGAAGYVWRDDWKPVRLRLAAGLDTVAIVAGLKQPGPPPTAEAELSPPLEPSPVEPPPVEPSPAAPDQAIPAPPQTPSAPATPLPPASGAPAHAEPATVEPAPAQPAGASGTPDAKPSEQASEQPLAPPPISPPSSAGSASVPIEAPAEPSGGPSEFQPIEATALPPPADVPTGAPSVAQASLPAVSPPPPSPMPPNPPAPAAAPPAAEPAPASSAGASPPLAALPPVAVPPAPPVMASVTPAEPAHAPVRDPTLASKEKPAREPQRGSPGLILLAGPDDTLPALYARVYRGVTPPPYADVLAANHSPVRPGDLLIFPEPPNGWSKR